MSSTTWRAYTALGALAVAAAVHVAEAQETITSGLQYQTVTPCRLIDTRTNGSGGPIVTDTLVTGGSTGARLVQVKGKCGVPSTAKAVALNLTVPLRDLQFAGHMIAYQSNIGLPATSNVNVTPGATEQNFGIVALAPHPVVDDMKITLFLGDGDVSSLGGLAHFVVDVVGYFFKP